MCVCLCVFISTLQVVLAFSEEEEEEEEERAQPAGIVSLPFPYCRNKLPAFPSRSFSTFPFTFSCPIVMIVVVVIVVGATCLTCNAWLLLT